MQQYYIIEQRQKGQWEYETENDFIRSYRCRICIRKHLLWSPGGGQTLPHNQLQKSCKQIILGPTIFSPHTFIHSSKCRRTLADRTEVTLESHRQFGHFSGRLRGKLKLKPDEPEISSELNWHGEKVFINSNGCGLRTFIFVSVSVTWTFKRHVNMSVQLQIELKIALLVLEITSQKKVFFKSNYPRMYNPSTGPKLA